jgi:4-hydroxybenzoate polyprenyltransferase
MTTTDSHQITPDSEHRSLIDILPNSLRLFVLLARFDRPIGWWLLYWPCAWGLLLAGGAHRHWPLLLWMLLGAIAMRGAGCVYNDIIDRDLDAQVARTRARPLASGAVSLRAAWIWLMMLALIGLIVLLHLPPFSQLIALASLAPVAAYPYMKRITWWPQAWLGIVFSWGALVGGSAMRGALTVPTLLLYAGAMCWVVGYDTIYACQDREDDALIGVRSSALRMGAHVRGGVAGFYLGALAFWAAAFWALRPQPLAVIALAPAALQLGWQVFTLNVDDAGDALAKFRSNRFTGMLVTLACVAVGSA